LRIAGKPELQERLAAEYALGTLRGRARTHLQRRMREEPALVRSVAEWEARLAPMLAAVPPAEPHGRVWRAIEARIGGGRMPARGAWESAGFWRALGLVASGMAAALLVAVALVAPQAPQPAPPPVVVRVPSAEMPAAYLAILTDPKSQKAVLVVSAGRKSDQLVVKTLDPSIHVAGRSLELWALPARGAPKSLGLVGAQEKAMLKLVGAADQSLADVPMLAVSLEPRGGSPTGAPTGPVLFSGPCVKSW
jgi:anti-sigma-K factor RskA